MMTYVVLFIGCVSKNDWLFGSHDETDVRNRFNKEHDRLLRAGYEQACDLPNGLRSDDRFIEYRGYENPLVPGDWYVLSIEDRIPEGVNVPETAE